MSFEPNLQGKSNLELIDRLLKKTDQIMLLIDKNGFVITNNDKAIEFFGKKRELIKGTNIRDLFILPEIGEKILGHTDEVNLDEDFTGTYLYPSTGSDQVSIELDGTILDNSGETLILLSGSLPESQNARYIDDINRFIDLLDPITAKTTGLSAIINQVAQFCVAFIADWCVIHLINTDSSIERVAAEPAEILSTQSAYDWIDNDLVNDDYDGLPYVIKELQIKVIPQVNPLRRVANTEIKSYAIVPIVTQHKLLGTLTIVLTESSRRSIQDSANLAYNLSLHLSSLLEKIQPEVENATLSGQAGRQDCQDSSELREAMEHLKQSDEFIQTLFRISNQLNATLDINQILDTLAQEAIQLVEGESGFAGLRTADGMAVSKYFNQGVEIPFEHTWAIGNGIPGWVLKYKVPYGTSDAANDPILNRDLAINANIKSIICTPILDSMGEVIAYFDIRNKINAEGFSINDQEMLLTLAPVASIAIQNALAYQQRLATVADLKQSARQYQLLAASLETAREEERVQIAHELHDQLGQALTALKFDLAWVSERLDQTEESLAQKTKDIIIQINSLINMVRRIATGLRPGMLEDLGLFASIEWQAQDFQKRSGIECRVQISDEDVRLTEEQSLAIFRIFQEALTNVIRYAGAKQVDIRLSKSGEFFTLQLNDDGRGISQEDLSNNLSIGIMGMQERAKQLGGIFEIQGVPNQGTEIKVTLPIQKEGQG